jgi:hypothetical protein
MTYNDDRFFFSFFDVVFSLFVRSPEKVIFYASLSIDRETYLKSNQKEVNVVSNKATDKAQTGKPDRGKSSPFKKKTPQNRA